MKIRFYTPCKSYCHVVKPKPTQRIKELTACSSSNKFRHGSSLKFSFLILLGALLSFGYGYAQTTALSFSTISNDYLRPGSGAVNWNDGFVVPIPAGGSTGMTAGIDRYCRFGWNQVQNDDGSYNWTAFDARVQIAINAGQKFSFGIMPICEGGSGSSAGGTLLTYPLFLHTQMQAESVQDWASSDMWVPNWNSPSFLTAWQNMLNAIATHIASTSYNGVAYKNVINYVDIRGYGNFGEWHNYPYNTSMPSNLWPTSATLEAIINSHISAFPNYPLVILIGAFDNADVTTKIPLDVIYYALTAKNSWGPIGWRRDNWGDATNYTAILENNPGSLNGLTFKTAIMSRYQTAPVTGEPLNGLSSYSDMITEVKKYGASSFGNGNIANASSSSVISDIQAASKAAGAVLQMTSGSISSTIPSGGSFSLTLNWQNIGAAPSYENWNTIFELRSGSTVAASWTSSFKPKLFLPGSSSVTDNLTIPSSVAAGNYGLYVIIRDPNGYRKPMPLSNAGAGSDGSYLIKNVTVSSGGSSNPVANAGTNQTITLPNNSVTLTGALTDLVSTLSGSTWTQLSGPNTATIASPTALTTTVSGLIAGVYTFQIKIIDLLGLSATASVNITVNPAPAPPVVSAGTDQAITLPTNTINLKGSASDATGTITTFQWTQVSGPNSANIAAAAALTTSVSGLVAGTYVFKLTVTDSYSLSASSTVNIIVNPAANIPPVANAGNNQTITLPVNSVTLNGSSSSDPDGSIKSYSWVKLSGPSQGTIANPGSASTPVNSLVQGAYSYQLTVTDNSGASNSDVVSITVNAAPNQPPVANAGSSKTITLPVNSVSLDGSQSSDPDGSIAGYNWTQASGPSTATISNANTSKPTASALIAGQYMFQLTVTDNSGATATAQVKIIVNPAVVPVNQSPIADAGSDQVITLPVNSVTLDGTNSSDPDGSIVSYKWTMISGPSQSSIANSASASTQAGSLAQGIYTFQLTVTDNGGATDTDTVKVTVNAALNLPPLANAGSSSIITLPVNSVSLDGSNSTDPDGTIVKFSWTQTSGPSTANFSNANSSTPTASALIAGQYMFQLTVTDNAGATSTAQVKIIVSPAPVVNQAPVANAGTDQTITLPVNSVQLDGTGSSDQDGTVTNYQWAKLSGPAQGSIANPTSASTLVNSLVQGVYSFQLTVTDNDGASNTDTVQITVNAAGNIPPVADAGASKTITLPTNSVALDGTNSSDPDGSIASYSWSQVSGPSSATITGANTSRPTVSALIAGEYTFELTVTDNSGATTVADVKVTVNNAANLNPVANAGASQTITLPVNSITLDGSGSLDPDGSISSYSWTMISGPSSATIASAAAQSTAVNNLVQGTYVFQLTVTDNGGNKDSDEVSVTVKAAINLPPTADAGSNQTITLPTNTVSLDGSNSSDPDGSIASYNWVETSGPSVATIANTGSAKPAISNLQVGTYFFQLTVTDNNGATGRSDVKVTVRAAANQPPVANAGATQTITLPTNSVTLDGSSSIDPDGSISNYSWTKISGPASANIVSAGNKKTTVNNLVEGTYVFQLTVTDNGGDKSSDMVTVLVNAAVNLSPNANAGSNKTITLPTNSISLDGSRSSDPDGTIVSYNWVQSSGPAAATITSAASAKPVISGLVAGTYYFQLTVTDNDGATDNSQVRITVRPAADIPPVANAGATQTITLPVNTVTLDGSSSIDPDGTIASYAWNKVSGPSQGSINNAGNAVASANNLVQGTYVYRLTVTDNRGMTNSDLVTVVVNAPVNQAPVADGGQSRTITLPVSAVSLDGSKSADPDGTIVSYSWTQISGPNNTTISNANSATPSISGFVAGQYMFQLTVTDNDGATGKAQVKIVVNAAPNQPPVADAGSDQTITLPVNSVTLDGSGSNDPDGSIDSYTWSRISGTGSITLTNSNTAKPSVFGLQAGVYVFQLTVTDNTGATSTDNVTITVLNASTGVTNQPPVANAGSDVTITLPTNTVDLDGSKSSDPDGSIISYSWTKVSGSGGTITNAGSAKPTISDLQAGSYTYKLTVSDNKGASASDNVKITVNNASTSIVAPVANAGADTTIAIPVTSVMLDGSASSGSITSYQWEQVNGPSTAIMATATDVTSTVTGLEVGAYTFRLTVQNSQGKTSTATVTITIVDNLRTSSTESILLYPNPAQSVINLRLLSDSTGNMKVNIFDMSGKLVLVTEMNKDQSFFDKTLNIGTLVHGMYTMQVIIGTKKSMVSKFLKL